MPDILEIESAVKALIPGAKITLDVYDSWHGRGTDLIVTPCPRVRLNFTKDGEGYHSECYFSPALWAKTEPEFLAEWFWLEFEEMLS